VLVRFLGRTSSWGKKRLLKGTTKKGKRANEMTRSRGNDKPLWIEVRHSEGANGGMNGPRRRGESIERSQKFRGKEKIGAEKGDRMTLVDERGNWSEGPCFEPGEKKRWLSEKPTEAKNRGSSLFSPPSERRKTEKRRKPQLTTQE